MAVASGVAMLYLLQSIGSMGSDMAWPAFWQLANVWLSLLPYRDDVESMEDVCIHIGHFEWTVCGVCCVRKNF